MRKLFTRAFFICLLFLYCFSGIAIAQPAGWGYLQSFSITNNSATQGLNIQVPLTVNTQSLISAGKMLANGNDIRFGNSCNGATQYSYYIDSGLNTANTVIWVKIDTLPASATKTIFMYTGNSSATAASTLGTFNGPFSSTDQIAPGSNVTSTGDNQRGFRFSPNTDILVTEFGKNEPNGTTRYATLFDFSTQAIIRQMQISGPASTYTYTALPNKLWLSTGTQYLMELYQGTGESYYFVQTSQINSNLTYYDMRYCNSCTQTTFPTNVLPGYQYGFPDFRFYTRNSLTPAPSYTTGSLVQAATISTQPHDTTVCQGNNAGFSIGVTGSVASYKWQVNLGSGFINIGGLPYSGASTSTLGISGPSVTMNNNQYRCLVTTFCGDVIVSDTVTLNVLATNSPAVTIAASQTTICAGQTDTFSVVSNVNPGSTPQYLWYINGSSVPGATNTTFTTSALANGNTVTCVMTSSNVCASPQTATSNGIAVTVKPLPANPTAGSNTPVCSGQAINLTASSATSGVSYTWTGPNAFSSSTQNPSIGNAATANAGTYTVYTTLNGCRSAATTNTTVVVNPAPAIGSTSTANPSGCGSATGSITLNGLSASTSYTVSYSKNGTPATATLSTNGSGSLTISNLSAGTYTNISVQTGSGCTSASVGPLTLSDPAGPATPSASSNSAICAGQTLNLTTPTVSGVSYSWTGPNGFSSSLQNPSVSGATTAASGTYSVTVTNTTTGCTSAAGTTTATVNALPATPSASSNSAICAGQTLNLSTPTVSGVSYSWTGPNSFASSSQNPVIANATTAAAGTYSVTITNTTTGCASAAGTTTATVNALPATPSAGSNSAICAGQTLNLTTPTVTGVTYSWTGPNSFTSSVQNPSISNATVSATGTYSVTLTNTTTGCTSAAGTVAATVNALPATPTASSNSAICTGQTLNLTTPAVSGVSYSWTGPNSFTSSLQNPSVSNATAANAGTYSVTLTNTATGCVSAAGTTSVTVNAPSTAPTASSNSAICAGQTLNLSTPAVSGATYSWTGPNGFTSSQQNPSIANATTAATGTYSVTVTTTATGCVSAAGTTPVVVNALPATPTASSNSAICAGQTLNLTTPTVSGVTYSWTGPNAFTATVQNPSIANTTTAAAGTYAVTITNTTTGCTSAAGNTTVTINALPVAPSASSNSAICAGQTLNLTTPAVSGATYSWTGPNSFSSSAQNPSIANATTAASGTYSLTLTNTATGCASATGTTSVTVNALPATPTASSNSAICAGQTLNLTTPTVTGVTYNWTGPNAFTSATQNPSVSNATAAAAGTYAVTITNTTTGCTSAAGTTTVVVNPLPATPTASSNSAICAGQTLNLTTPTVAGMTYSWTGPNSFTSSVQNPSVSSATTAAAGTYTVKLTNTTTGCVSANGSTNVTVNALPATPSASSNSAICAGQTLNLSTAAASGMSYSWTGPNSFSSGLQNPAITNATTAASGTYSLILTNTATGCTSAAGTTSVTVKPLPAAPTAGSNSPVCVGSNLLLNASTATSGATYTWSGPNSFSSTTQNPTITGVTANANGTYTVYSVLNGCQSATGTPVIVVVNPTPVAAITAGGPLTFCANDSVLLHANSGTGLSYQWFFNNGPVANSFDSIFKANVTGSYKVTVTNIYGCNTTSTPVAVTVNPVPVSTITYTTPITFCEGGAVVLSSGSGTGFSYQWLFNGTPVTGATGNFIIAAQQGNYALTTISPQGCSSVSQPVHITVHPLPQPLITRTGNTLTTTLPYMTYQWYRNNNQTFVGSSQAIAPTQNGGYYVTVTDSFGCTNTSQVFFVNNLGIGHVTISAIKIYPNPVKQVVYIDAPVAVHAEIRDLTGRSILKKENAREIDLHDIADGVYLIILTDEAGRMIGTERLYKIQ